jgi:hypothetical protein
MKTTFNYFDCQFIPEQLYLGGHYCLQGKEALAKVMGEDFRLQKTLVLVHPRRHFAYYHEYVKSALKDIYIIRVCNQRIIQKSLENFHTKLEVDFPYLYVVVDFTGEQPLFRIENWEEVVKSTEEVASVLTYSMNFALQGYGWKLKLVPSKKKPRESKLLNMMKEKYLNMPRTMGELYGKNFIEKLMPIRTEETPKNTTDFKSAIIYEDFADEVITLLHKSIKGKVRPKDIMRPIHAVIVAGVTHKITLKQFQSEFGNIMDEHIYAFRKYTSKSINDYDNDTMHEMLVQEFEKLVFHRH